MLSGPETFTPFFRNPCEEKSPQREASKYTEILNTLAYRGRDPVSPLPCGGAEFRLFPSSSPLPGSSVRCCPGGLLWRRPCSGRVFLPPRGRTPNWIYLCPVETCAIHKTLSGYTLVTSLLRRKNFSLLSSVKERL